MMLQSDPTVLYALGLWKQRTFYKDLDVKSPYNTYRNRGLPPGPICNPGRAAVHAVLFPNSDSTELYFVARGDGTHIFSRSWEDHLKAIAHVRTQARPESTLVPIGPGLSEPEPQPVLQAGGSKPETGTTAKIPEIEAPKPEPQPATAKVSTAKTPAVKSSTAKASTTKASATRASATRASATRASATKAPTAKTGTARTTARKTTRKAPVRVRHTVRDSTR
jgi:hypothetical protein